MALGCRWLAQRPLPRACCIAFITPSSSLSPCFTIPSSSFIFINLLFVCACLLLFSLPGDEKVREAETEIRKKYPEAAYIELEPDSSTHNMFALEQFQTPALRKVNLKVCLVLWVMMAWWLRDIQVKSYFVEIKSGNYFGCQKENICHETGLRCVSRTFRIGMYGVVL